MLSRLLLIGTLSGASLGGFLGQQAPAPFDWGSLAGGAVGSFPAATILAWRLTKADAEKKALQDENRGLNIVSRELTERVVAALTEASRAMVDVRDGMAATVNRSRPQDLDGFVRRFEALADDLERERRERR
jgi:hypothetical protein